MQQGNRKNKKLERQQAFHRAAARPGAPGGALAQAPMARSAVAPTTIPVAPMQSHPGAVRSAPPPQVQPHQAVYRSGEQVVHGAPVFAPIPNAVVQAPYTPPAEDRTQQAPTAVISGRPVADVTVILYSGGASAQYTARQVEAIRAQTVQPAHLWAHVDGPHNHDEKTLARLELAARTPLHFGRYHRLSLGRAAPTRYVAFLDEDTIPGKNWLARVVTALEASDPGHEAPFGNAVVASSGSRLLADDPFQVHPVGPEFPSVETMGVDFGRQGWVMQKDLLRVIQSLPWHGTGRAAFSFAVSAAAAAGGVAIVVLDYGTDQNDWGALAAPVYGDADHDVVVAYKGYRGDGWRPDGIPAAQQPEVTAAPEGADAGSLGPFASEDQLPPAATHAQDATPEQPMPQSPSVPIPSRNGGGPPTSDIAVPPGAKVTRMGGFTQIERIVDTPTPKTGQIERVLTEPTAPPPASLTERVLAVPSEPPPASLTEHVVAPSAPSPAQQETSKTS